MVWLERARKGLSHSHIRHHRILIRMRLGGMAICDASRYPHLVDDYGFSQISILGAKHDFGGDFS